jgi:hypothetical protein
MRRRRRSAIGFAYLAMFHVKHWSAPGGNEAAEFTRFMRRNEASILTCPWFSRVAEEFHTV